MSESSCTERLVSAQWKRETRAARALSGQWPPITSAMESRGSAHSWEWGVGADAAESITPRRAACRVRADALLLCQSESQASRRCAWARASVSTKRFTRAEGGLRMRTTGIQRAARDGGSALLATKALGPKRQYRRPPRT